MAGQTIVKYGTVFFYNCLLLKFHQEPFMESSRTDNKGWKYTIVIKGYLHGWNGLLTKFHSVTTDFNGDLTRRYGQAVTSHTQVRWRLPPRQTFAIAMGCTTNMASGDTLLYAQPLSDVAETPSDLTSVRAGGQKGLSGLDVNDGPICTSLDIVHASADNIFEVHAAFEVHQVQCDDDGQAKLNTLGILSNRWATSDNYDHNMRTTRVHRGLLELATSQWSPHWFRSIVMPPLGNGFRRDQMNFQATEDGRKLAWTVVDQEIAISCPPPAKRWNIQHTEHTLNRDGIIGHGSCQVTLEGDSNVDKTELITLGLSVISNKLLGVKLGEAVAGINTRMGDITITDMTGDVNMIQVSATCQRGLKTIAGGTVVPYMAGFRKIIQQADLPVFVIGYGGYDPRQSEGGRPGQETLYKGPASLISIMRCYLQIPCDDGHATDDANNNETTDLNTEIDPPVRPNVEAIVVSSIDEADPSYYSLSNKTNTYTNYQCETIYKTKTMRAALPIAKKKPTSGGPDTSDSTAIVELAPPQARCTIRIVGERIGEWPEFPDPEWIGRLSFSQPQYGTAYSGPTYPQIEMKCLDSKLLGGTVDKTANQENLFRARFEATMALKRAPTAAELLKFGHNKWMNEPTIDGAVSNAVLTGSTFT